MSTGLRIHGGCGRLDEPEVHDGRMRLMTAHRVLIATAIALGAIYAAWELTMAPGPPTTASWVRALLAASFAVALAIYWQRYLRKRRS